VLHDSTTYGVVWCADKHDDPFDEETWKAANPGFGISPTRSYLAKEAARAKDSPADLAKFLRLHLGIRTKQETKYLELAPWDASAGLVVEEKLAGRQCHGGLDLASVNDLTALCWDFHENGKHELLWRFWLPEDRIKDLDRRTAGEATVWVRQGRLTLTPGNVIDNDFIVTQILRDAEKFEVKTIGYDRWGANDVVKRLSDEGGLTCVPVGQGFATMSGPLKEILRLVLSKQYVHGADPVMRWMVDNLAVAMDPAGNVKPDKSRASEKIDGVSAAATAMREFLDAQPPKLKGLTRAKGKKSGH
jgi:phage terminase large subunit-like protein